MGVRENMQAVQQFAASGAAGEKAQATAKGAMAKRRFDNWQQSRSGAPGMNPNNVRSRMGALKKFASQGGARPQTRPQGGPRPYQSYGLQQKQMDRDHHAALKRQLVGDERHPRQHEAGMLQGGGGQPPWMQGHGQTTMALPGGGQQQDQQYRPYTPPSMPGYGGQGGYQNPWGQQIGSMLGGMQNNPWRPQQQGPGFQAGDVFSGGMYRDQRARNYNEYQQGLGQMNRFNQGMDQFTGQIGGMQNAAHDYIGGLQQNEQAARDQYNQQVNAATPWDDNINRIHTELQREQDPNRRAKLFEELASHSERQQGIYNERRQQMGPFNAMAGQFGINAAQGQPAYRQGNFGLQGSHQWMQDMGWGGMNRGGTGFDADTPFNWNPRSRIQMSGHMANLASQQRMGW